MKTSLFILLSLFCANLYAQDGQYIVFNSSDGYTNILESYGQKYPDWGHGGKRSPSLPFVEEKEQGMIMGTSVPMDKYNTADKSFQTEEVAPLLGRLESSKVYLVFEKVKVKEFGYLIRPLSLMEGSYTAKPEDRVDRFYLLINANTINEAVEKGIYESFKGFYNPEMDAEIIEANK